MLLDLAKVQTDVSTIVVSAEQACKRIGVIQQASGHLENRRELHLVIGENISAGVLHTAVNLDGTPHGEVGGMPDNDMVEGLQLEVVADYIVVIVNF